MIKIFYIQHKIFILYPVNVKMQIIKVIESSGDDRLNLTQYYHSGLTYTYFIGCKSILWRLSKKSTSEITEFIDVIVSRACVPL